MNYADSNIPTPYEDFRHTLAANLTNPADYSGTLVHLLSIHIGLIQRQHHSCSTGCRTCKILAEIVDLARAHNSLQTFNEALEEYEPYPLLSLIDSGKSPDND